MSRVCFHFTRRFVESEAAHYTGTMRCLAVVTLLICSLLSYHSVSAQVVKARALVLEPFATQLSSDGQAGMAEVSALERAGFTVTILTGDQVTVPVMMHLTDYNVIYIETHSAILPNGDAVIATGETNNRPYASLFGNGGLLQTIVAGGGGHALYNAVTGRFFALHLGSFAPGSILFINGCAALSAPVLWQDLHARGLSTLIGWNGDVPEGPATAVGTAVMDHLGGGETVAQAVLSGAALPNSDIAPFGFHYEGVGTETLANALAGSLPAPPPGASVPVPRPFAPHLPRWGHLSVFTTTSRRP